MEYMGVVLSAGKKKLKAPTIAMAMAPLVIHTETQYPQATKNPIKSPKPALAYAYGPPLLLRIILLKLLNTLAKIKEPIAVKIHPNKLIPPYGAKAAGNTKIPEPIIFPITKEVVIMSPILCGSLLIVWIFP